MIVIIAALGLLWPLLRPGFFSSDDGEWMVIRLSAFFQSFRDGQFPVRFLGRLNNGYGYPVANFLYPGFLYVGSLVHALGFSFVDSVKIVLGLSVAGSSFFLYLWLRKSFSNFASIVGTLSFQFAPYIAFDIYRRGSVGEIMALLPATMGLYALGTGRRWIFALAVGWLIVSHNSLAMLFLVVYAVLICSKYQWRFVVPAILGMGASMFFWVPALFERRLVLFDSVMVSDPTIYFVEAERSFLFPWVSVVAFFLALVSTKRLKSPSILLGLYGASVVLALGITRQLWGVGALAMTVQFPYRFLAVSSVVGTWLVASLVQRLEGIRRLGMVMIFILLSWLPLQHVFTSIAYIIRDEAYYTTNEATTTVANEYLPRWVKEQLKDRANVPLRVYQGNANIVYTSVSTRKIQATIDAKEQSVIQINTIYYPGWGVAVDGNPIAFNYNNPQGVMRVSIAPGTHGIIVEFRETALRLIADFLSVVSGGIIVVFVLREKGVLGKKSS